MNSLQISNNQARALMVAAQGLHRRPAKTATKIDVLRAIQGMGVLQIDSIHVVARSAYLVLWSRLGNYQPSWLDELLTERKLFEYWSHEACFIPIEDYFLYRYRMNNAELAGWKYSKEWVDAHRDEIDELLRFIRENGAVRASDFKRTDGKSSGWWEWKTEKRALEMLLTSGDLMIARREKFQRVYDLTERVLQSSNAVSTPSAEEVHRESAMKAVKALGITTARWVSDYFRTDKKQTARAMTALVLEGALLPVDVEGWKDLAFVCPTNHKLLRQAVEGKINLELTSLLSPFDPLIWDRQRTLDVFGFDYRLECYTPEAKRKYGYFTLPILHRGELIGRLDAKAHRKDSVFEVKLIHFEKHVVITDELLGEVASEILECAKWHKTPTVIIRRSVPTRVAKRLSKAIAQR
jgi:hypothetical protein